MMRRRLPLAACIGTLACLASLTAAGPETYESATLDPNGRIHIVTSEHRDVVIPMSKDQSSFEMPVISQDRNAVGTRAYYGNCCTSYDIPMAVVIYTDGRTHRFTGTDLPIFQWHFADSGTQVAFGQEPVHFSCSVHYELRDIRSERLIDSADIPEPCGQNTDPGIGTTPKWVVELNADRR
jgi:hypothetical protein